ncbi:hypothetical protein SCALIN_C28_0046 [Candidatus Scalindua japonica]|uniref:Uncharacterized protein n=1 Tax=Candidatus Scalindua japonica TaxID=1284222 RepID=A0A286U129_9BACT|nr:hypothetical protein SCALIN_C28_0046 [Candidatus Scalindua japonica]
MPARPGIYKGTLFVIEFWTNGYLETDTRSSHKQWPQLERSNLARQIAKCEDLIFVQENFFLTFSVMLKREGKNDESF